MSDTDCCGDCGTYPDSIKQHACLPKVRRLQRELIAACEERDRFRKDSEALDWIINVWCAEIDKSDMRTWPDCPEHLRNKLEGKKT